MIETKMKKLFCQIFEQRTFCAKKKWNDVKNLKLKNFCFENLKYLTKNDLTNEMNKKLRDINKCLFLSQFNFKKIIN